MRVLIFHNQYSETGGEDIAVDQEVQLLREHGVEVSLMRAANPSPDVLPLFKQINLACQATWSKESYSRAIRLCREHQPDVVHVHNFWLTWTPSVHKACHDAGIPTVQTLHNYRLLCLNALMLREGKICEDCVNRPPWRGVFRRCYRGSFTASSAVAGMVSFHRMRHTWFRDVDLFITPSNYARSKLSLGQIPADRIAVKANVVAESTGPLAKPSSSDTALYVGRLSEEKGVAVLLSAWAKAKLHPKRKLLIVGNGPYSEMLRDLAESLELRPPHVVFAGTKSHGDVRALIAQSRILILPSLCAETFGNSVVEAFCAGRPAVVSDCGALAEIVEDGRTGYKVPPANIGDLADCLNVLLGDDDLVDRLGQAARLTYLSRYSVNENYRTLMHIYRRAIEQHRISHSPYTSPATTLEHNYKLT